nr:dendritic cell protein [Hymenolepis microstoma]
MAPPMFTDCTEADQVDELNNYLRRLGADIVDKCEVDDNNWPEAFVRCIPQLKFVFRNDKVSEAEESSFLVTISSLVMRLPSEFVADAITKLCALYEDFADEKNRKHFGKLYSLDVLFNGLPEDHHSRYFIYRALVACASDLGKLAHIHTETEMVERLLKQCNCTPIECQSLWRQMSAIHQAHNNTKLATQALINLLSTYTDGKAAGAQDDAFKCIVAVIKDPSILDHGRLMSLKPVQFLEGEPIHKLLKIYVSGGLADFIAFNKEHPSFLADNGLDEKICLDKLRTLTLMEIAENAGELDYTTACKKLGVPEDQLESFIIEAVQQKVITCKLDQINQRILITGALPRTFGRSQWQSLYLTLKEWESGLRVVQNSLAAMIGPTSQ